VGDHPLATTGLIAAELFLLFFSHILDPLSALEIAALTFSLNGDAQTSAIS
jgi:hypothetical protein